MNANVDRATKYVYRHLRFGWWSLLAFLSLGIVLEAMHGFKIPWYMDLANETRRTMWTLAHAHGGILALVHIGFGITLRAIPESPKLQKLASPALIGASVLIPGGFLLGGIVTHAGDPGLGILLLPVGAIMLLVAVLTTAMSVRP